MKDNVIRILKFVGSFLFAVVLCYCTLIVIDTQYDHMVGNWFEQKFTYLYNYSTYEGEPYYIPKIDWENIKKFGFQVCGIGVVIWLATVYITVYFTQKKAEEKALHKASLYMREYLSSPSGNEPASEKKYRELMTSVGDFKSRMIHNERVLRDETSKKNDLIAYLAHDLKTPLTSVVGYLSLLEEAPDMPLEQKTKYQHIALKKAIRLEQLINEFFEITRYNLHEIVLEKESIDLNYMLIQMADEFYPLLRKHNNSIRVDAQEGLTIQADPDKMARVFNNILKNAVAYSRTGSEIAIQAAQKENRTEISFVNQGKTIPKQKLESIFEKFFRMDEARSTNNGGAGLGLAIAREIVHLHGGDILASSEKGTTTFTVVLPSEEQ